MHLYRAVQALLALQLGCGSDATCAIAGDVQLVSIEEGGMCTGSGPCWIRTIFMAPDTVVLENPEMRMTAELSDAEVSALVKFFKDEDFCSAVEAPTKCAVTFETGTTLKVETSSAAYVDKEAGDCIFGSEASPVHPLRAFYLELDRIKRAHFPGVLKESG